MSPFWFALLLTTCAGLSTGIGSALAFMTKKDNATFLSFSLGMSAGVMIFVSLAELMPQSAIQLEKSWGKEIGRAISLVSFFAGVGITALIDMVIPSPENPHEPHKDKSDMAELRRHRKDHSAMLRIGIFSALAIGLHNLPEGLATFISATSTDMTLAYTIALAVAIHNIPEGIAVAVPIYFATGSRKKAFWYSFASGLSEPVGGVIGYLILKPFIGDSLFGIVFAGVAGIMVYISLDELLPSAREYGQHHTAITGLFIGMALIGISLIGIA